MKIKKYCFLFLIVILRCISMEAPLSSNEPFMAITTADDMKKFAGKIVAYRGGFSFDAHIDSSKDSFGYITKKPNANGAYTLSRFMILPEHNNAQLYINPEVFPFSFELREANKQELQELKLLAQSTTPFQPTKLFCKTWGTKGKNMVNEGLIKKIEQQMTS